MMEESEAWRCEGSEQPWVKVSETNERFVLQLHIRELGTMFTMLSSNLAQECNIEDTKDKAIKIAEKFIQRWSQTQK